MTILATKAYKRPPLPAIPYPRFGVGILPSNPNNNDYINILTNTMTQSVSGSTFTMNDSGNTFMYFASPAVHGDVTFIDHNTDISGGWDGATWPTDGSIAETLGKVQATLTFGSDTRLWYIYRTDFKGIGTKTYKMMFNVQPVNVVTPETILPGIGWADLTTAFANPLLIAPDAAPFVARMDGQQYLVFRYNAINGKNHVHNATGIGNMVLSLYDSTKTLVKAEQDINNGPNGNDEIDYKYMSMGNNMYLVVFNSGPVGTIRDFNVFITLENVEIPSNGWDTRALAVTNRIENSTNINYTVLLDEQKFLAFKFNPVAGKEYSFSAVSTNGTNEDVLYYLHDGDTNFIGSIVDDDTQIKGEIGLKRTFGNTRDTYLIVQMVAVNGGTKELDINISYDTTPSLPGYGVGNLQPNFIGDEAVLVITERVAELKNGSQITMTAGNNEYMYFASPVENGLVTFTDASNNYSGGWDGASWPNDGNIGLEYGPVILLGYYIYRTDFANLGTKTYTLQYQNVVA